MTEIYEDWGGDEIDLRAAEDHDFVEAELLSQGTAEGTVTLDALTFTAPTSLEILALRYRAHLVVIGTTSGAPPALAGRRLRGKAFNITTLGDFGTARVGDYITEEVMAQLNDAFEDETNGTGGIGDGVPGRYVTLIDPGQDSPTGPLTLTEGETISVHLQQVGFNAPTSPSEQTLRHRLDVWWEETPEAETEVRARGSFPRSGSRTEV